MTISAVKLVDLIERGRDNADLPAPTEARHLRAATKDNIPHPEYGFQAGDSVTENIEVLAIKLYSISRSQEQSPREIMREALRSIEHCLICIKSHH